MTTNGKGWYNEWQQIITSYNEWQPVTANDNEWEQVVQRMKTNESKGNRVILSF